jgi:hypothetical protein
MALKRARCAMNAEQIRLDDRVKKVFFGKNGGRTSGAAVGNVRRTTAKTVTPGLLHPRPCRPAPTVGGGRNRRDLDDKAAAVLPPWLSGTGATPSSRSALRTDQQRGEPRRRRQGVLILPRLHADPLLHEVSIQIPRTPFPTRILCAPTPGVRGRRWSTSCSTPASSTGTAISTSS